jgi:hypothetical protein
MTVSDSAANDCSRIRKNAGSQPTRILANAATTESRTIMEITEHTRHRRTPHSTFNPNPGDYH